MNRVKPRLRSRSWYYHERVVPWLGLLLLLLISTTTTTSSNTALPPPSFEGLNTVPVTLSERDFGIAAMGVANQLYNEYDREFELVDLTRLEMHNVKFFTRMGKPLKLHHRWYGLFEPLFADRYTVEFVTRRCRSRSATSSTPSNLAIAQWIQSVGAIVMQLPGTECRAEWAATTRGALDQQQECLYRMHEMELWRDIDAALFTIRHQILEQPYLVAHHRTTARDTAVSIDGACIEHATPSSAANPLLVLGVVSYNVWNFNRNWEHRLTMLHEQISATGAAVVALQEVRYDLFEELASAEWIRSLMPSLLPEHELALTMAPRSRFQIHAIMQLFRRHGLTRHHEWQFVYEPSMTYLEIARNRFHVDEGLAVLSRYPIVETERLRLTRSFFDPDDDHHRACLRVKLALPPAAPGQAPQHINLFNTHLSLSAAARRRTAVELWRWIKSFPEPAVLVGDLNATPDDDAIRFLTGELELDGERGDMIDAWSAMHHRNPDDHDAAVTAPSLDHENGYTFIAWNRTKRIDFVLTRNGLAVDSFHRLGLLPHERCHAPCRDAAHQTHADRDQHDTTLPAECLSTCGLTQEQLEALYASDHLGLHATFTMKPQSPPTRST